MFSACLCKIRQLFLRKIIIIIKQINYFILMWNFTPASKILQQKSQDKNYQLHKEKLRKMASIVKIKQPQQPIFVYVKPKLEMSRRDRLIEISRQNDILLKKMSTIQESKHPQDKLKASSQWLKTLNLQTTIAITQKIDQQNKKLCNRLMEAHSHYPTRQIIKETSKLVKNMMHISENARRFRALSRSSIKRPNSAIYSSLSRFVRTGVAKQNMMQNTSQKENCKSKLTRPQSAPSLRFASRQVLQEKKKSDLQRLDFDQDFQKI